MSSRKGRRERCAFTLAELVIVILIIGILAGTAAPKFASSLKQAQVDAACLRIKADLNLARQTAISGSTSQSVVFTNGSATYTLPGMTHPDHPALAYTVNLAEGAYQAVVSSAVFGAGTTVQFDRYGQPSAGGVITVIAGGITKTVTVDATSGVARIP